MHLVELAALEGGVGTVTTFNSKGQGLVMLSATGDGEGAVTTFNSTGRSLVELAVLEGGLGTVTTFNSEGQRLIELGATNNGGAIGVQNRTGQRVCTMMADEHGDGQIGAWDRKGEGRTLRPEL